MLRKFFSLLTSLAVLSTFSTAFAVNPEIFKTSKSLNAIAVDQVEQINALQERRADKIAGFEVISSKSTITINRLNDPDIIGESKEKPVHIYHETIEQNVIPLASSLASTEINKTLIAIDTYLWFGETITLETGITAKELTGVYTDPDYGALKLYYIWSDWENSYDGSYRVWITVDSVDCHAAQNGYGYPAGTWGEFISDFTVATNATANSGSFDRYFYPPNYVNVYYPGSGGGVGYSANYHLVLKEQVNPNYPPSYDYDTTEGSAYWASFG